MRSGGLTAADWAVITEHQETPKPPKEATQRLEGRGKDGKDGAIGPRRLSQNKSQRCLAQDERLLL